MDVLLTLQSNTKATTVSIFWGHNQTLGTVLTGIGCCEWVGGLRPQMDDLVPSFDPRWWSVVNCMYLSFWNDWFTDWGWGLMISENMQ